MVVLLEGATISTEELWSSVRVTIEFLVTSMTKALLSRLLSLAGQPALGRVLVVPNFLHLKMEATVFWGTFNAAEMFWYPSPELIVLFPDMHCQLWDLCRQVCAFPNHVQSIEFTTGGLQSGCRNIKDDQWKQNAPELNFESHSKGSECLCKQGICFLFEINWQHFLKTCFRFVIVRYYGVD